MLIKLNSKESFFFLGILLIEYILLYLYFVKDNDYTKIFLLIIIILSIKLFNNNYIFINNIVLIIMIFFFYLKDNKKEGFTSKLKLLKDVNHNKRNESNMNSNTLKKKKEKFGSTNIVTYQEYNESFKTYPFTKRSKSSKEALNKMPLYIEKFKEIFN